MHYPPTPLSTALHIIHYAELSELPAIKDSITASLLADMKTVRKREPTGNTVLDEVRSWVDEYKVATLTADRLRMLKRIVARQQGAGKPVRGGITEAMIEQAREVDIQEVFTSLVGTPIRHGMASCPWHDDKNASFSMRRYNRYRCFSCGDKGTVIDLYMKVSGVGFIQAVKQLLRV